MIEFLRDNWVWFLTLFGIFGLLGILTQLWNMAKLSRAEVGGIFKRFGLAMVFILIAGINMFALIASFIIQAIEHFQTTGAS